MIRMQPLWTLWLAATLVTTSAASSAPRVQPAVTLRGPQKPAPVQTAPAEPAPGSRTVQLFSPLPEAAQRFTFDAAPRIGGLTSEDAKGQCRQSCAQEYYVCSSTDDRSECQRTWTRCLSSCAGGLSAPS